MISYELFNLGTYLGDIGAVFWPYFARYDPLLLIFFPTKVLYPLLAAAGLIYYFRCSSEGVLLGLYLI